MCVTLLSGGLYVPEADTSPITLLPSLELSNAAAPELPKELGQSLAASIK